MIVEQERRRCSDGAGLTHIITLNRVETGNALDAVLVENLISAIDGAQGDSARLIVFRGGGRHFCTGFDLAGLEGQSDGDLLLRFVRIEELLQKVETSPIPTMTVAHGRVVGAGADLFTACDHRVAVPNSSFTFPGAGFGIVLGTRRLAGAVGRDTAREIVLSGRRVTEHEGSTVGLVTRVIDESEVDSLIDEVARDAARLDPYTVRSLRRATCSAAPDADLAALVRSASRTGLKQRICDYAAATRAAKTKAK